MDKQARIRGFVIRWRQELRDFAEEMDLDPDELTVFASRMFIEMPKAPHPSRAIDVYKREVYASHKGTGKDVRDKDILLEISGGWKTIKEDKDRLKEYEELLRTMINKTYT